MKKRDLTNGNVVIVFLLFALPLFLGSLFQQLYSTVDLIFVGNCLGKADAAAVGASGILVTCLIGLFSGISVGTGVVSSQYWGANNHEEGKNCMEQALVLGVCGGAAFTVLGFVFSEPALKLLNTPDSIMENSLLYIRIYLISVVPMVLYNMSAGIMRSTGDSKTPFLILASGGIVNVCLDAYFLVYLQKGIQGAAFATLIAQSYTAVSACFLLIRREKLFSRRIHIKWHYIAEILKTGIPLGAQSMILTLSNLIIQSAVNRFGETSIAAFTVYLKAENLLYLPIVALGQAMVTFTGQNFGAGNLKRIKEGAVKCNFMAMGIVAGLSVVAVIFDKELVRVFCKDKDVINAGAEIIRRAFPFYFIYALLEVTGGIVRGVGKTFQSMLIVVGTQCLIRVLILELILRISASLNSVIAVYPVTWILAAGGFVIYCRALLSAYSKKDNLEYRS